MFALMPVHRYLQRFGERECTLADAVPISDPFDFAVALPCFSEDEGVYASLDHLGEAARFRNGRGLVVLLVNASEGAKPEALEANRKLWVGLTAGAKTIGQSPPAAWVDYSASLSLLVVRRSGLGLNLPAKWGVGGARKVACDIALALWARGAVRSPYISTTDADARVAPDYFSEDWLSSTESFGLGAIADAGLAHPFEHGIDERSFPLALYEIFLRYYVEGLRFAGSPYAFPTIGSCVTFRADAYAMVRGFPKREAGEDFYFLGKLAKVGRIRIGGGRVNLVPRESDRVPFGTGRGMAKIRQELAAGKAFHLYEPEIFEHLRTWLRAMAEYAVSREIETVERRFPTAVWEALRGLGLPEMLVSAASDRKTSADLLRHLHTSFDGFQTLKFVHTLRDRLYPNPEGEVALRRASFLRLQDAVDWPGYLAALRLC